MWSAQAVRDSKIDHTQRHLSALRGTRSSGLALEHTHTFENLYENNIQFTGICNASYAYFIHYMYCTVGAKVAWDFRISDLVKKPDGTDV